MPCLLTFLVLNDEDTGILATVFLGADKTLPCARQPLFIKVILREALQENLGQGRRIIDSGDGCYGSGHLEVCCGSWFAQ